MDTTKPDRQNTMNTDSAGKNPKSNTAAGPELIDFGRSGQRASARKERSADRPQGGSSARSGRHPSASAQKARSAADRPQGGSSTRSGRRPSASAQKARSAADRPQGGSSARSGRHPSASAQEARSAADRSQGGHSARSERRSDANNTTASGSGNASGENRKNRHSRSTRSSPSRRPSESRSRRAAGGSPPHGRKRRAGRNPLSLIIPLLAALVFFLLLFSGIRFLIRLKTRDKTPPVIELSRVPDYYVGFGESYEEEGYTATDDRDGDLTSQVKTTVSADTVCYEVTDQAGNSTVEYRTIPRRKGSKAGKSAPSAKAGSGSAVLWNNDPGYIPDTKVIYLTFDDGPSDYTEHLLEILDKYNVPVTFFVTGSSPRCAELIAKEYASGHSIGVHTFTHDFKKIYADTDAFWADFEEMEKVILKQTGRRTKLMRFAGGSSNTLSAEYTSGIMTVLTKEAEEKGYHYFDWNVSSGDASTYFSGQDFINNIISQVQNNDHSVVLCHDTKETTVNNIEYVITWALENGYTFFPLNENSETAHHAILN